MPSQDITFKGRENSKYNDDVFRGIPFIAERTYQIKIFPIEGRFWRLGFRFSTSENIAFSTDGNRHGNINTPDLHWAVGEFDQNDQWTLPGRLQLVQYNFPRYDHVLTRNEDYKGGPIEMMFSIEELDSDFNVIKINSFTEGISILPVIIELKKSFKYFAPFAWAENIRFEIQCSIFRSEEDQKIDQKLLLGSFPTPIRNFWMMKLNPANFKGAIFRPGSTIHFGTHTTTFQERDEYDLYHNLKPGDIILGYAMEPNNGIVNEMRVVRSVFSHPTLGEVVELIVEGVLFQPILPEDFSFYLNSQARSDLERSSRVRLIALNQDEYESILKIPSRQGKPKFRTNVHPEGAHSTTPDQLDFDSDIEALSTIIALKELVPPLAIGLFGNWGTGKSFFMEKLQASVLKLGKSGEKAFVDEIVQVRFNAWHYHDSNLWASLISEIFDSLSNHATEENEKKSMQAILESLEITKLERASMEGEKKVLENKVVEYKERRSDERAQLKDLSGIRILRAILGDVVIQEQFEELKNEEIEEIVQNTEKIKEYIQTVSSLKVLFLGFFKQVSRLKGRRWLIVIIFTILIYIAIIGTKYVFSAKWQHLTAQIAAGYAVLTTIIGGFIRMLIPYVITIRKMKRQLDSLLKSFGKVHQERPEVIGTDEKRLLELTRSITKLDEKIDSAEQRVQNILTGSQLRNFINHRIKDGSYASKLGLISVIRKDFETLDNLLRQQQEGMAFVYDRSEKVLNINLRIERLVLYIDDLDRCDEHIVLKVLEAINLLLAFPLFVVVVGVDPRWLDNSINLKFGALLGNSNKSSHIADANQLASPTSYDYLEKIFQVPFAIRTMTQNNREKLLDYLLNLKISERLNKERSRSEQGDVKFVNFPEGPSPRPVADVKIQNNIVSQQSVIVRGLIFEEGEIGFIKKLSFIFGSSPRTINRFVNLYRIIRCHNEFKADLFFGKDHEAALLFLAILVGRSADVSSLAKELSECIDESLLLDDFVQARVPELNWFQEILKKSGMILQLNVLTVGNFKKNLPLLCRFSFRTIMR